MKKVILGFVVSLFMISSLSAGSISEDDARAGIIGTWKLLSYAKKGENKDDYSTRNVLWNINLKKCNK